MVAYKRKPATKKRVYRKKKTYTKKNMKMTARRQALALKITKLKNHTLIQRPFGIQPVLNQDENIGTPQQTFTGMTTASRHWEVFNPLYLQATAGQHEANDREDMRIYALNCRAEIEVYMNKMNIDCCYVRCMYGYYKGLPNLAQSNLLDYSLLESLLPTHTARLDPANATTRQFKILSDRTSILVPKQLFDSNWSDDTAGKIENIFGTNLFGTAEGTEITNALWLPYRKRFNFKFNRQFTYQNSDADSIVGMNPFIAIGVFPCGDAPKFRSLPMAADQTYNGEFHYTDSEGSVHTVKVSDTQNPSPALSVKLNTYFKDIM